MIPAEVLIDIGIEHVPDEHNVELTNICAAWAKARRAELETWLTEHGYEATVKSQAGDYLR